MSDQPVDHTLKVVMLGDSGVGKSSLMGNFITGTFEPDIGSTIGVDFKVKYMTQDGKRVKLTLWDTAGQERFRTLTSSYYRGIHGVVIVYDVSNRDSFEHVTTWVTELIRYVAFGDIIKLLVANKTDLPASQQTVSRAEGLDVAKENGMIFIETSAKTSIGVNQAFTEVVQKVLDSPVLLRNSKPAGGGAAGNVDLTNQHSGGGGSQGCCW